MKKLFDDISKYVLRFESLKEMKNYINNNSDMIFLIENLDLIVYRC